jgi:hypothetical protein
VQPTCEGERLEWLRVEVVAPGPTPSPADAIARAADATSGVFDRCLPEPGHTTKGTIGPPPGSDLSGFEARCSAAVRTWNGFAVVTFFIVAPAATGSGIVVPTVDDVMTRGLPPLPEGSNGQIVMWRIVVPSRGSALPVASASSTSSRRSRGFERSFDVSPSGWVDAGSSACGGSGFGEGSGGSATITFLDGCGA